MEHRRSRYVRLGHAFAVLSSAPLHPHPPPAYPQCDVFFPTIDWNELIEVTDEKAGRDKKTTGDQQDENRCVDALQSMDYYGREREENGAVYSFHVYQRKV